MADNHFRYDKKKALATMDALLKENRELLQESSLEELAKVNAIQNECRRDMEDYYLQVCRAEEGILNTANELERAAYKVHLKLAKRNYSSEYHQIKVRERLALYYIMTGMSFDELIRDINVSQVTIIGFLSGSHIRSTTLMTINQWLDAQEYSWFQLWRDIHKK